MDYFSPRNENLNLLVLIKFLNLFLYSCKQKLKKIIGPSKDLLVLVQRTGAHREDCYLGSNFKGYIKK